MNEKNSAYDANWKHSEDYQLKRLVYKIIIETFWRREI